MEWQKALKISDLKDGQMEVLSLGGKPVVLAQVGQSYFAFDDECTHRQCSLGGGFLEGTALECPCHGARFDISNGGVLALPATVPIRTYATKVEEGTVFVEI